MVDHMLFLILSTFAQDLRLKPAFHTFDASHSKLSVKPFASWGPTQNLNRCQLHIFPRNNLDPSFQVWEVGLSGEDGFHFPLARNISMCHFAIWTTSGEGGFKYKPRRTSGKEGLFFWQLEYPKAAFTY